MGRLLKCENVGLWPSAASSFEAWRSPAQDCRCLFEDGRRTSATRPHLLGYGGNGADNPSEYRAVARLVRW